MVDGQTGDGGVAAPFALTRHDEVEVEGGQQSHKFRAGGGVDTDKGFVEHDQARGGGGGAAVVRGGGRELRDGQGDGFFAARSRAIGFLGQPFPDAVLFAFDLEAMPFSVIKCAGELLLPSGGLVAQLLCPDLLLEEVADRFAVGVRPDPFRAEELFARFVESCGAVGVDAPCETEHDSGTCGAEAELFVHLAHPLLALADEALTRSISQLREAFPDFSQILAGPLLAIEARIAFSDATQPAKQRLESAYELYLAAAEASRYRAGAYTKRIYGEALGVSAFLQRRQLSKGSILPQITRLLSWWNLLGMGDDYRHEHQERRIAKAEDRFIDMISEAHRELLRSDFPDFVIPTRLFGGLMTLPDPNHPRITEHKVRSNQKRPVKNTSLGRDTPALMLTIENQQLEDARKRLNAGKDELNFINTEGDTVITKAFAAEDYELVMLILKREVYPVKLETIQRVTDKKQNSPLERAVALGCPEILKELANYGPGNRPPLEMNSRSCRGQAPLYYGIQCFYEVATGESLITEFVDPFGTAAEILSAIDCLVDEIGVELDVPNENDHTALTFCAELGLTDLAIKLLSKGANPNHRISGGGTALCFAIQNDDARLVSALLEFKADYTLYVDSLGRPIYTMPMSERLRNLIPYRLS